MESKKKNKSVIIMDFDKTITEKDIFEEQIYSLPLKTQDEIIKRLYTPENWAIVMNETYKQYYELNTSISEINSYIDKVVLTNGMIELINYLYNNKKDKYILVILSGGHLCQINYVLQKNNLNYFFDEIICLNFGKIIVEKNDEYICDKCEGIGQCKTKEFNLLKNKYESKNIFFDKIYYICDGINDFCLARNLKSNDELLIRNNYSLDKYLINEGFINNIKSKVNKWNNGFDIIEYYKIVLNYIIYIINISKNL